jgi:hypothetical protein
MVQKYFHLLWYIEVHSWCAGLPNAAVIMNVCHHFSACDTILQIALCVYNYNIPLSVVKFDGANILPVKKVILQTSFGAKFLMLLPYHIILSLEICLTDWLTDWLTVAQSFVCQPYFECCSFIHPFIHSIGMCRMRLFLAVLSSFFHSSLLYTLSFHHFPPNSLPSSLTLSCHLFLGLLLSLVFFQIHI